MKCPYCRKDQDKVLETRSMDDGRRIRRRRECLECGKRFTSFEAVEEIFVKVVKRDGRRAPFDLDKVLRSVNLACRKRPIDELEIHELVWKVESRSLEAEDKEISSSEIGRIIMEELEKIDPVAFVRFASVYRDFQNVDEFIDEIRSMKRDEIN